MKTRGFIFLVLALLFAVAAVFVSQEQTDGEPRPAPVVAKTGSSKAPEPSVGKTGEPLRITNEKVQNSENTDGDRAALVTVYEASSDKEAVGELEVTVEDTAPPVLVLNAYEKVHWRISGGAHLEKVIVSGYEMPELSGLPSQCKVIMMSQADDPATQDIGSEMLHKYLPNAYQLQSADMARLLSELGKMGVGVESIAAAHRANQALIR